MAKRAGVVLNLRNVDVETARQFKAGAAVLGLTLGDYLTVLVRGPKARKPRAKKPRGVP